MSGKKQNAAGVSWSTCSSCKIRYHNRNLLQKHQDLGCGDVHPCLMSDGRGTFELSLLDAQQSRLFQEIPPRKLDDILFLHTAFLAEMKLKTLDCISITKVRKKEDANEEASVPMFMRVWAIEAGPPYKAFVHSNCAVSYPALNPGKDVLYIGGIEDNIPLASVIVLAVQDIPVGLTISNVLDKMRSWLPGKVSTPKAIFRVQLLTHIITVQVSNITQVVVETNLPEINVEQPMRVSKETEVIIESKDDEEPEKIQYEDVTLQSVGGLAEEIKEVSDTITYVLSGRPGAPRGILLYGEYGTGKSLLMKAICNSMSLTPIYFKEFGTRNIRMIFQEAIRNCRKSAILVENVDSLSAGKREGDENVAFAEELLAEMDGLPKGCNVVVIGTAKSPDQIHPALRSVKVFAKEVELPVPSAVGRLEIIQRLLIPYEHLLTVENIQKMAEDTHGFVGADLEGMRATAFRLAGSLPPTRSHFEQALRTSRPSAMKSIQLEIPHVCWDDIGGLDKLKFQLKQSVEWPLKHPEAFSRLGLTPPKGILMYGPPGCSKTMIAKALATETHLNFISVKGSDLLSKWVGESEKAVQSLFRKARKVAPAILFFDELDALGAERGGKGGGSNVHERVLAQLLVEIDGIEPLNDVTILAATNRPDLIDKALTRPGRLDRIIYVPLPDPETRREILRIKMARMPLSHDVDLNFLVEQTEGYSGAEIGGVCQEAGLKALEGDLNAATVSREHFKMALAKSPPRITPELLSFYDSYAKLMKD